MTNNINKAIELGKIRGAKALLKEYYSKQHRIDWIKKIQEQYSRTYPPTRLMTNKEKNSYDDNNFSNEVIKPKDFVYPKVTIDYTEDKNYITFDEYLNQTIVVQEATEGSNEVREKVFKYVLLTKEELIVKINNYQPLKNKLKEIATFEKNDKLNRLTITISTGKTFYADPTSRADIADVITLIGRHLME